MPEERALRQIPDPCRLCGGTVRAPSVLRMDAPVGALTARAQLVVVTVRVIPDAGCDREHGILM